MVKGETGLGRFERISSQRIYAQIVEQIARLVREGSLRPGDKLPAERQLAEEFGVSRAAVREATSALCLMGLLEVRAGEGTYIRDVGAGGLVAPLARLLAAQRAGALGRELLEVRLALEAETAWLAAQRREPDDLAAMAAALETMAAGAEAAAAEADWRFHAAVAAAAGNSLLLQLLGSIKENMRELIGEYRRRLLPIPDMDRTLQAGHREIFAAIRDGDPALARERMRAHIQHIAHTLYADTAGEKEVGHDG